MSETIEHLKTETSVPYTRQAMPYQDGGAFLYLFETSDLDLVLQFFRFREYDDEFKYDGDGGGEWYIPHHCGCTHDCCGCCCLSAGWVKDTPSGFVVYSRWNVNV